MMRPEIVNDFILKHSREKPDSPAVYYQNQDNEWFSISWRDYAAKIRAIASGLLAYTKTGDRFGILLDNCLEWDILEKAGFQSGIPVAGIDSHAPGSYQQYILDDAKICVLSVRNLDALRNLDIPALTHLRLIITLEPTPQSALGNAKVISYSALAASGDRELPAIDGGQDAMIVYTSGTSGNPAGIAYTHRQYMAVCESFIANYPISADARIICWLPLANLFQRIVNLMAMRLGASVYIVGNPRRLIDEIKIINPTFLIGVPRFYEKLAAGVYEKVSTLPYPIRKIFTWALKNGKMPWLLKKIRVGLFGNDLKFLITGSAPMNVVVMKFYHALGVPLYEAYGQSENILPIAMNTPANIRMGSVGKPFGGNEVVIREDEEIWVRGTGVFRGYLNGSTQGKFAPDGFLATGDKGYFDKDGFLYLTGRKSDIIKTSTGRKIIPLKIEMLLLNACSDFDQVIVTGHGKKHLLALASLKAPRDNEQMWKKAIATINNALADYEKIFGLLLIPALTVEAGHITPNLKLRRKKIEEAHANAIESLYQQLENSPAEIVIMKAPMP